MSEAEPSADEALLLRAAHHYHCKDTGCFDGDDIAQPEVLKAIREFSAKLLAAPKPSGTAPLAGLMEAVRQHSNFATGNSMLKAAEWEAEEARLWTEIETQGTALLADRDAEILRLRDGLLAHSYHKGGCGTLIRHLAEYTDSQNATIRPSEADCTCGLTSLLAFAATQEAGDG